MADTPDDDTTNDTSNASLEATADAAVATAGKVATGVLDTLEALLFGRVGGAEDAAKADEGDPITRMRTRYNADVATVKAETPPGAAPTGSPLPRPDPVARARAELEALKAARAERVSAPDAPPKKTL